MLITIKIEMFAWHKVQLSFGTSGDWFPGPLWTSNTEDAHVPGMRWTGAGLQPALGIRGLTAPPPAGGTRLPSQLVGSSDAAPRAAQGRLCSH